MNQLITEALIIGLKEGFKIGIVWLVFYSYLILNDKKSLIKPFYIGVFFVSLISVISFFLPQGLIVKDYLSNVIATSFAILFILSAAALFHASGVNLFRPLKDITLITQTSQKSPHPTNNPPSPPFSKGGMGGLKGGGLWWIIVFLSTLLFFSPDSVGTVLFLKELSLMKDTELMTYISAFIGLLIAVAIFFIVVKFFKPYWIGSFFDIPQLLLFLAIVKLLGGGIKGFAELSLIPSVQRGFMKFSHDVIHQTFVLIMVPDHLLLKTTVWNFIGIFFGSNIASVASLFILLFFPFMFIYHSLFKPLPEPEAQTSAQRRKIKSLLLSNRRRKALPVIFFISFILIAWFSQSGEPVSRLYNPKPRPVVKDKGVVMIPLNDPTMDLMDGALHKFSLTLEGEEIRIIIIKKSNNALSVCLDACEICPPEGYGQRGGHVICIYCNTPIPIDTLGEPGGCNPIPLTAMIDDRFVKIELDEILKKWEYVNLSSK